MAVSTRFNGEVEANVKTGQMAEPHANAERSTVRRRFVMPRPGKASFMEEYGAGKLAPYLQQAMLWIY
jgi:hypothetical protein